jgi:hypothetical protein
MIRRRRRRNARVGESVPPQSCHGGSVLVSNIQCSLFREAFEE